MLWNMLVFLPYDYVLYPTALDPQIFQRRAGPQFDLAHSIITLIFSLHEQPPTNGRITPQYRKPDMYSTKEFRSEKSVSKCLAEEAEFKNLMKTTIYFKPSSSSCRK